MKQLTPGPAQTMVGSALGAAAATTFSIWANRRHIPTPVIAGLYVLITGTVVIITNYLASVIGRVNLKTALGWAATAFIVWWVIQDPGASDHVAANIGTFMAQGKTGIQDFFISL